jgi:Zn finger protein HypA/HybF involved in hydrogenase expression
MLHAIIGRKFLNCSECGTIFSIPLQNNWPDFCPNCKAPKVRVEIKKEKPKDSTISQQGISQNSGEKN